MWFIWANSPIIPKPELFRTFWKRFPDPKPPSHVKIFQVRQRVSRACLTHDSTTQGSFGVEDAEEIIALKQKSTPKLFIVEKGWSNHGNIHATNLEIRWGEVETNMKPTWKQSWNDHETTWNNMETLMTPVKQPIIRVITARCLNLETMF